MKTSAQVIRVSAVRAREGAPSLSSWLDTVQVRPLADMISLEPRRPRRGGSDRDDDAAAPAGEFFSFKIL